MKRIGFVLALALCSCISSSSSVYFAGTYVGTITETYTCLNSSPPQFQLQETFTVTQDGEDIFVTMASCSGMTITAGASGDSASVDPTGGTSRSCQQQDPRGGTTITVDGFSGG